MAEYLRVRQPGASALLNPVTGLHEAPRPEDRFERDHPLVKAYPWAFGTEDEIAAERDAERSRDSVLIEPVEQATNAPGEKRASVRKPRA